MTINKNEKKAILKALQKNIQDQLSDQEKEELIDVFNKILKIKRGEKIELQ